MVVCAFVSRGFAKHTQSSVPDVDKYKALSELVRHSMESLCLTSLAPADEIMDYCRHLLIHHNKFLRAMTLKLFRCVCNTPDAVASLWILNCHYFLAWYVADLPRACSTHAVLPLDGNFVCIYCHVIRCLSLRSH